MGKRSCELGLVVVEVVEELSRMEQSRCRYRSFILQLLRVGLFIISVTAGYRKVIKFILAFKLTFGRSRSAGAIHLTIYNIILSASKFSQSKSIGCQ